MATAMKKSELQRILQEVQQIRESRVTFERELREMFGENGGDLFKRFYYYDVYKFYKEINEYLELVKYEAHSIEDVFPIPEGYLSSELDKAYKSGISAIPTVANHVVNNPEKFARVSKINSKPDDFIDNRIDLLSELEDINLETLKRIGYRDMKIDGKDVERMNYKPNRLFAIKFLEGMKKGIANLSSNLGIKVNKSKIDIDDEVIDKIVHVALNNWYSLIQKPYNLIVDFISEEYMNIHKEIDSILTSGFSVTFDNNMDAYLPVASELSKIQMIARGENSLVDKLIAKQNLSFDKVISTVNTAATSGIDESLFVKRYI